MAKETDLSFWTTPTPPTDWEGLVSYIRPRNTAELHELFDVKPPRPPDPNAPPPEDKKHEQPSLLDQLRLREDEFVELALQQPELWTEEELDYLYLVASEGKADKRLDELARDYFSGARRKPPTSSATSSEFTLDSDIDTLPEQPGKTSIPDLKVLEGTMNVDRWWEKQK